MRAVWIICAKDLRQRFRDRSALALGVVAPLAIATLISFAFQSTDHFSAKVGIVDLDHGPVAGAFVDVLKSPDLARIIDLHPLDSEAAARRQVDGGDLEAAIVIPAGLSEAITGATESPVRLTVLTNVDDNIAGQVVRSITGAFAARVNGDRLAVAAALAAGAPADRLAALTTRASDLRAAEDVAQRSIGAHPLTAISYYAPGMAIFFLFFAIGFGARSFFTERNQGTLARMAASPVHPLAIVAGKALSILVYGSASMAIIAVVTSVAFGARWGDPLAATLLTLAMVLAVVALTALVITVARTERQAEGWSSALVFGLALLGGNFVFVSAMPPIMRRLALLTPNGWALRGYIDLATGGGGLGSVVVPVVGIAVFSVVILAVAAWRAPRLVRG